MATIVQRIIAGNELAFTEFARQEYPQALRTAMHIVRSRAVAQEVVQDALLELWKQRAALDPTRSPVGLLITIVRRRAINVWRKASAERECFVARLPARKA